MSSKCPECRGDVEDSQCMKCHGFFCDSCGSFVDLGVAIMPLFPIVLVVCFSCEPKIPDDTETGEFGEDEIMGDFK